MGCDIDLKEIAKEMSKWYEIKIRGVLGDDDGDDKELTILGRNISWRDGTIKYEADMKHAEVIIEEMGLGDCSKVLDAPIENLKPEDLEEEEQGELMDGVDATKFRGLAARANYLSLDRVEVQFAAKEICRKMSRPKKHHWKLLMRLARYLLKYPRLIWTFGKVESEGPGFLDVYSDSDWAGDKVERKSTSGGIASISGGAIKHWASTQSTIALSSGEAEYYALIKAAAEGLGIQSVARDLGIELTIRIWVDSTAAKAVVSRIGLGKVRHMEVKYLWAQQAHKAGRFLVRKIAGTRNPADVLTKPLSAADMGPKIALVGASLVYKRTLDSWVDSAKVSGKKWADMDEIEGE